MKLLLVASLWASTTTAATAAHQFEPHSMVRREEHRQAQAGTTVVGTITSLVVMDADTNQPLVGFAPITMPSSTVTIDVSTAATGALSMEALTQGTVGSIQWKYSDVTRAENAARWCMCGNANDNVFACDALVEGFNSIVTATPYPERDLQGTPGPSSSVNVTIIRSRPMILTLMDSINDVAMGPLTDAIVNLSVTPDINVRADIPTGLAVRSVRFWYDGTEIRTENAAPFAMNGNNGDDFFAFQPAVGCHDVTARAYAERDARGKLRATVATTFCVVQTASAPTSAAPVPLASASPSNWPSAAPFPLPSITPSNLPTLAPVPTPYTCNDATDTCEYLFNEYCEGGLEGSEDCAPDTDCFDCDPCRAYAYDSCEACTSAPENCVWCGTDASCISPGTVPSSRMSCGKDDYLATCPVSTTAVFADPLYDSMEWMYDMIKVQEVWKAGITGKGVGIRINDEGVDHTHPEFSANFDVAGSCELYEPVALDEDHTHGTTCASLAAGGANSVCSVGVAPDARIGSCRAIGDNVTTEADDWSFLHVHMDNMHVSSNSYGYDTCYVKDRRRQLNDALACPFVSNSTSNPCKAKACKNVNWIDTKPSPKCESVVMQYCSNRFNYESDIKGCSSFLDLFVECIYNSISYEAQMALAEGITNGREGKGIVYAFAAGNDFDAGGDVNFQGLLNNRFVISVGAVRKNKMHASYSTPGAAIFVAGPAGDSETRPNNVVAMAGGGCVSGGIGTSFSTPVVSGVVALMLQVNNNLSWRDVQGIIAATSQKVFPDHSSWTTNADSYWYGFGIIDASASVAAAKTWVPYTEESPIFVESGSINVTIPEFQTPSVWAVSSINVPAPANMKVESVLIYIDLSHSSRGDLDIFLVSPQGTSSLLAPGERPENQQLADDERWKLMTVRNWGESANGNWTLRLVDRSRGDLSTCVNIPGWSVGVKFPDEITYAITCKGVTYFDWCANGKRGPGFLDYFDGVATKITDPVFTNKNNVSMTNACCECGGGKPASSVPDVLKSWKLAVYGHVE